MRKIIKGKYGLKPKKPIIYLKTGEIKPGRPIITTKKGRLLANVYLDMINATRQGEYGTDKKKNLQNMLIYYKKIQDLNGGRYKLDPKDDAHMKYVIKDLARLNVIEKLKREEKL